MVFTDHIFWFSKMHLIKTTNFNGCKTTKLVNQTSQTTIQEGKWATLLKEFYAPSDMTYSCNVSHKI